MRLATFTPSMSRMCLHKDYFTVTATLHQVTDHVYWYTEDNIAVDLNALKRAANTFESSIYPTDGRLFGSEWTPGVDNDPHITVLFASVPGARRLFLLCRRVYSPGQPLQ